MDPGESLDFQPAVKGSGRPGHHVVPSLFGLDKRLVETTVNEDPRADVNDRPGRVTTVNVLWLRLWTHRHIRETGSAASSALLTFAERRRSLSSPVHIALFKNRPEALARLTNNMAKSATFRTVRTTNQPGQPTR